MSLSTVLGTPTTTIFRLRRWISSQMECAPAHGPVAADHEEDVDAHALQGVDHVLGALRAARRAEHGAAEQVDVVDHLGVEEQRACRRGRGQALEAVAEAVDAADAVAVPHAPHQAADDVVHSRAEPAAGDHGGDDVLAAEVVQLARAGSLEEELRVGAAGIVEDAGVGRRVVRDEVSGDLGERERRGVARLADGGGLEAERIGHDLLPRVRAGYRAGA
jgi:hypothetical protein